MNVCLSALLWSLNHHCHVEGINTTSFLRALSWFSSELLTFVQFHRLVISEITFLTPKNSVLILHPPPIQHLSQPLLGCILEPLLCSSFFSHSPYCAVSWSPCCALLSGTPAVLQLIWRECLCQQNLLLINTKNYVGRDRTKL